MAGIRKKFNHKRHKIMRRHPLAMLIPLLLAFVWMGLLIFQADRIEPEPSTYFAPTRINAQINSLFAFIIIYGLFLLILFWHTEKWVLKPSKKRV